AQPLGRLRRFEAEDFGPAPSLSAPTPTTNAPSFTQFTPGAGTAGSQAAAASRIPRFSGFGPQGGRDSGAGPGNGGTADSGTSQTPPPLPVRPTGGPANGISGPGQDPPGKAGAGQVAAFGGPQPGEPAAGTGPGTGTMGMPGSLGAPGSRLPSFTDGAPGASGTGPMTVPAGGGASGTGPMGSLGPVGTNGTMRRDGEAGGGPGNGTGDGDGAGQVTIPPVASPAQDQRLPIFDSLESDWFRRSGKTVSAASATATAPAATQSWSSPADEGWRAARVVASPAAGETTSAGLPKRVPRANLVPGSVGGGAEDAEAAAVPSRSADAVRSRMASFQRGVREARAAAPENEEP
ncbi:MAG: hypothetical protein JO242_19175, partial [Streptosporangiaceae bacterium]|nr:hypothetical protein [Streptosporangiaceae bacterium]